MEKLPAVCAHLQRNGHHGEQRRGGQGGDEERGVAEAYGDIRVVVQARGQLVVLSSRVVSSRVVSCCWLTGG
jgi:hypothetical protein